MFNDLFNFKNHFFAKQKNARRVRQAKLVSILIIFFTFFSFLIISTNVLLDGYGHCKCPRYGTCKCQTKYGVPKTTYIEYMHGTKAPCPCSYYRSCRCLPEKFKHGVSAPCKCSYYRSCRCLPEKFKQPLADSEDGGLSSYGQYVYLKPLPMSTGIPDKDAAGGVWKTFGTVVPPFGIDTINYPIQGKVILPGRLYRYRILVGNQLYHVYQVYRLVNGDVVDILGFDSPVRRWRVKTNNNFWDHNIVLAEEKAYRLRQ
jgi:hypothetical protein